MHRSIVHRLLDGGVTMLQSTYADRPSRAAGGRPYFGRSQAPRDSKYEIMALKELVGRKEDASFVMSKRQRGC
eukprot:scaffold906_cov186-Alexandrium_tamarense.AAC.17